MQVNEALVDAHLKAIKGFGTFTTGRFAGGDAENFSWETDGSLHTEVLLLGAVNQVRADYYGSNRKWEYQYECGFISWLDISSQNNIEIRTQNPLHEFSDRDNCL